MAKRGLGRGLDALFPSLENEIALDEREGKEFIHEIKISDIDPSMDQPRKSFKEESIMELAQSIKQYGVVQPIIVKPNGKRYSLIAGERRWRAARMAGLTKIPAVVKELDGKEAIEIALIENLQREDLNPIEEAMGIRTLIEEYGLTQEMVAERIGKSRPAITNALRLLSLPQKIQEYLIEGRLTSGHGRALLGIQNEEVQMEVAELIIKNDLSVRETERAIQRLNDKDKEKKGKNQKPGYIIDIEEKLEESLGTRVVISPGKKKGKIEIEYYSNEDLERIIEKISK